jgi:3-dehydroquinate dehydratase-2
MRTFTILIANGPNLGHIGRRQPEIYGSRSITELTDMIRELLGPERAARIRLDFFQANGEGQLIDRLEEPCARAWTASCSTPGPTPTPAWPWPTAWPG